MPPYSLWMWEISIPESLRIGASKANRVSTNKWERFVPLASALLGRLWAEALSSTR